MSLRKDKDISLNSTDYLKLKGTYSNYSLDTNHLNLKKALYENLTLDTTGRAQTDFYADILPADEKTLVVNLYRRDKAFIQAELIKSVKLKGKFKSGYFKVKRHYPTKFIAGPLIWILGEHQNYIGLSKENNLVVLDSGGTGILFIVAVPLFIAGGDRYDYEYKRIK